MKKPKVHSTKIVHYDFFDVRQDMVERNDGVLHPYSSLFLSTDATAIIAQDPEGRWILNREYRHPTGQFLLGCPGGRLEAGEDPIQGGQREFFEETGYWSDDIAIIGCCHPFPGICNQKIYFLWAKNAHLKGKQQLDPFEVIETELKTDAELRQEIQRGTNIDAILCTALWYKDLNTQR
jgi:ADP-ribose pyrophosphatase